MGWWRKMDGSVEVGQGEGWIDGGGGGGSLVEDN